MRLDLLLVIALAAWRCVRCWTKDEIFTEPRIWLRNTVLGKQPKWFRTKLDYLIGCPWCLEFYATGIAVLIVQQWASIPLPVLIWFAAWGLTPLFRRFADTPTDVHLEFHNTLKHKEQRYEQ